MSALERPPEVLLVASFDAAGRAEAAARAFLQNGLDADRVSLLARDTWETAFAAVPRRVVFRVRGLGRLLAVGALAVELAADPRDDSGHERLEIALRRLGLSIADLPRLERALRADTILVLLAVPSKEAYQWGRLLRDAGAVSLSARPRLIPWPPHPRRAGRRGREHHAVRRRTASRPSRLEVYRVRS